MHDSSGRFLVGFQGTSWSGGAFPSDAGSAKEAAKEILEKMGPKFIEGKDNIRAVCVTDMQKDTVKFYRFTIKELVGPEKNAPKAKPAPRKRKTK